MKVEPSCAATALVSGAQEVLEDEGQSVNRPTYTEEDDVTARIWPSRMK